MASIQLDGESLITVQSVTKNADGDVINIGTGVQISLQSLADWVLAQAEETDPVTDPD